MQPQLLPPQVLAHVQQLFTRTMSQSVQHVTFLARPVQALIPTNVLLAEPHQTELLLLTEVTNVLAALGSIRITSQFVLLAITHAQLAMDLTLTIVSLVQDHLTESPLQ